MSYAATPHVEAFLEPIGTGTPYKITWVNDFAKVLVVAGWTPEVKAETNDQTSEPYYRTIAPVVLRITQTDTFASFSFFSSPPGDSCDGLSVWSVTKSGGQLSVGWDNAPGPYSETMNCCVCAGGCDAGVHYGTGSGGTGTNSCGLDCVDGGAGLCIVGETWTWPSGDLTGQHNALLAQIVKQSVGCTDSPKYEVLSQTITSTSATTYLAIWCEGGATNPLVGASDLTTPGIGAAFNTSVVRKHGGWVLHSQPSNTDENVLTMYVGVDRFSEGASDIVAATYPFAYVFSTYTASTHPILYIEGGSPLTGIGDRIMFRNDLNRMRIMAGPYQAFMYSFRGAGLGTATSTGSQNTLVCGALRTVPVNGESPMAPATWSFRRALYFTGAEGTTLHQQNWVNPNSPNWYMTIDTGAGTHIRSMSVDDDQLCIAGYAWSDRVKAGEPPITWVSGEAFLCEPWAGFNANSTATGEGKSPILGQMWDCIVPSKAGGTGFFFWDGEWWEHWQHLRTDTTTDGGPHANIAWRVGFQTLEGEGPDVFGEWAWPVDPRDVFLYAALNEGLLEPFPWGNVTGVTISTDTFSGGTTTATLTVTCTEHPDAQDDGDKLVAVHSPRNYFTFTPEVITISSGATTGTSLVTALSPGLGGVDTTIYADSITQGSVDVTVND